MIDLITTSAGIDTSASSLELGARMCRIAVNRSFRGKDNQTRPPFVLRKSVFLDSNAEYMLRFGNVTGCLGYQKTGNLNSNYGIIASGDSIIAGRIVGSSIEWQTIYKGIPSLYAHSFFVQAENNLVWNNGKDYGLYWPGYGKMKFIFNSGVEAPMPVGNIMTYAHGRIFIATEEGLVYASNYVYSNGKNTLGVLNFKESSYFNDGDGFGAPSVMGEITGASVIIKNPQTNGHGPVVFFCSNGAFALNPTIPRDQWIDNENIQQSIMTGRGCGAHASIVQANSDLWFRCSDSSISSIKNSIASANDEWAFSSQSTEVDEFTKYDSSGSLEFGHGLVFDNRLIQTVAHRQLQSTEFGNHRFALGMVVADLHKGSRNLPQSGFQWDGLWTGIRSAGCFKIFDRGSERAFFISHDNDGENRIYELTKSFGNDIGVNGESRIKSWFIYSGLLSLGGGTDPNTSSISIQKIEALNLMYYNAVGKIRFKASFAPDDYQCFTEFQSTEEVGSECTNNECGISIAMPKSGHVFFKPDCKNERVSSSSNTDKGEFFSIKIEIEGNASIRKMRVQGQSELQSLITLKEPCVDLSPINCCTPDNQYFEYLIQ